MHWAVYIRRSHKRADSASVSDETQEAMARALLPPGATHEVIRDSGGHRSGATTDRDGYQELIGRLRSGAIDGIAVYDLSRLHRNALNMLALMAELERRQVPLLVATMPSTRFDGAIGRFILGQMATAAQLQRDLDSDRMVNLTRSIFEAGGHRGLDPFGYRTIPGVKPRTLEVVEHEAAVVRRIWSMLPTTSTDDIARRLNVEGVAHRVDRPWTRNAVKDIVRRGRFYLGHVTRGRGLEERPGRHAPILDEATWRVGFEASRARHRGAIRTGSRRRTYVLAGLLHCGECGGRMHGQASLSRGQEWRYYLCRHCDRQPSVPAADIEAAFRERVAAAVLPPRVIDRGRAILAADRPVDTGAQRRRLEQRRDRLAQLYAWGDLTESAYRTQRTEVERELALLPTDDGLLLFDRNRVALLSMAEAARQAPLDLLREAALRLVEYAETEDRGLGSVLWTPPAMPFLAPLWVWRPRADSNHHNAEHADPLAYYRRSA